MQFGADTSGRLRLHERRSRLPYLLRQTTCPRKDAHPSPLMPRPPTHQRPVRHAPRWDLLRTPNPHHHPRSMNRTNTLKTDDTALTNDIEAPPGIRPHLRRGRGFRPRGNAGKTRPRGPPVAAISRSGRRRRASDRGISLCCRHGISAPFAGISFSGVARSARAGAPAPSSCATAGSNSTRSVAVLGKTRSSGGTRFRVR